MPHICFSESGQHWLVPYSAPSHYLDQCLVNVNGTIRNKLQWNYIQNTKKKTSTKIHLKLSSAIKRTFVQGELNAIFTNIGMPWVEVFNLFYWNTLIIFCIKDAMFHQCWRVEFHRGIAHHLTHLCLNCNSWALHLLILVISSIPYSLRDIRDVRTIVASDILRLKRTAYRFNGLCKSRVAYILRLHFGIWYVWCDTQCFLCMYIFGYQPMPQTTKMHDVLGTWISSFQ